MNADIKAQWFHEDENPVNHIVLPSQSPDFNATTLMAIKTPNEVRSLGERFIPPVEFLFYISLAYVIQL